MAKQGPRKKLPKELAVINADNCTGCESCLEVCPVDCIFKVQQYDQFHNLQSWCEIDIERCVGCEVCVHIPGKKTNPYDLKVTLLQHHVIEFRQHFHFSYHYL